MAKPPFPPRADDLPRDRARTEALAAALAELAPALEAHLAGHDRERARERSAWKPRLDHPLPAQGLGADAVLALLRDVVVRHGLPLGAPGFCGWVTTAPPVVPAAAALAASLAASQRWWVHPGNFLELHALGWLAELCGLAPGIAGAFTSGGSTANLVALGAARQHAAETRGVDPALDGVAALPAPRIYASEQVHHVVLRAAGVLGLGRRAVRRVAIDRHHRVVPAAVARAVDDDLAAGATPIAVVATAGDVNTGAIDPIDELRAIAHARGVWLHVDGAYGGFGQLDPRVAPLYGDLTAIDSFAVDPHKWLGVPVGCGAAFVRDGGLLARAFSLEPASYMPYARRGEGDPGSCFDQLGEGDPNRGIDHSAPSRGLVVWAALAEIGADGVRERVRRHLDCARRVATRVRGDERLELLAEPVLSICCFRYHPPEIRDSGTLERFNRELLFRVRARGRVAPSETRVHGKLALRPCFIGARAGLAEADLLVDEVLAAAAELDA
jgi:aromatic-L-amino-acid decarboxylase